MCCCAKSTAGLSTKRAPIRALKLTCNCATVHFNPNPSGRDPRAKHRIEMTMAHYQTILYEKKRRGAQITLNRPQVLNALNDELWEELDGALEEAKKDPEVRAVVLTGAGGVFSTGEDLSVDQRPTAWPYGIAENSSLVYEYDSARDQERKSFLERQMYRWGYPKPIIGAVSGWCLGAASSLSLTFHLTFAADDAVFGQPQIRHSAGTDF